MLTVLMVRAGLVCPGFIDLGRHRQSMQQGMRCESAKHLFTTWSFGGWGHDYPSVNKYIQYLNLLILQFVVNSELFLGSEGCRPLSPLFAVGRTVCGPPQQLS